MPNLKNEFRDAKAWAAGHVVLAMVAGAVLGFILHAVLF